MWKSAPTSFLTTSIFFFWGKGGGVGCEDFLGFPLGEGEAGNHLTKAKAVA